MFDARISQAKSQNEDSDDDFYDASTSLINESGTLDEDEAIRTRSDIIMVPDRFQDGRGELKPTLSEPALGEQETAELLIGVDEPKASEVQGKIEIPKDAPYTTGLQEAAPPIAPLQPQSSLREAIQIYSNVDFWNPSPHAPALSVIEVLKQLPNEREIIRSASRRMLVEFEADSPQDSEAKATRVRIRSSLLVELLDFIAAQETGQATSWNEQKTSELQRNTSKVYLYPFKLFVLFEEQIRRFMSWVETPRLAADELARFPKPFRSPIAKSHLNILIQLFDGELGSVFEMRRKLLQGKMPMIDFGDLWLLYEPGQLVYERGYSSRHHHRGDGKGPDTPPRLWRVVHYSGARPVLNNDDNEALDELYENTMGTRKKGLENRFIIKGYSLDANARFTTCVPIEEQWSFPQWDGPRDITQLRAFPITFCRTKQEFLDPTCEAYLHRLRREGRRYCSLKQGMVYNYNGPAVDAENIVWEVSFADKVTQIEFRLTPEEQYNSEVIIDTIRARQEERTLFSRRESQQIQIGLGPFSFSVDTHSGGTETISILPGDRREILEKPARKSRGEPKNLDIIQDDIMMEFNYFKRIRVMKKLATSSWTLSGLAKDGDDELLAILPRDISAFVLSARKWARLNIQYLRAHHFDKTLWNRIVLPDGYKDVLLATVENSNRVDSNNHISILGKGIGTIILLQGHPGTGKTFTAQALAARTERALYPVTSGELGDSASQVEQTLYRILQRGRAWNCILLLDEGDVYLTERSYASDAGTRNSIVSVFLRLLENFTGIIIITTNWNTVLDSAVLDRVTLPLVYPILNGDAVKAIWDCYSADTQQFVSDRGSMKFKVRISPDTKRWAERKAKFAREQYNNSVELAQNSPWQSGRQIQTAFRLAISLAIQDTVDEYCDKAPQGMGEEQASMTSKSKRRSVIVPLHDSAEERNTVYCVIVTVEHFKRVFNTYDKFFKGIEGLYNTNRVVQTKIDEKLQYESLEVTPRKAETDTASHYSSDSDPQPGNTSDNT